MISSSARSRLDATFIFGAFVACCSSGASDADHRVRDERVKGTDVELLSRIFEDMGPSSLVAVGQFVSMRDDQFWLPMVGNRRRVVVEFRVDELIAGGQRHGDLVEITVWSDMLGHPGVSIHVGKPDQTRVDAIEVWVPPEAVIPMLNDRPIDSIRRGRVETVPSVYYDTVGELIEVPVIGEIMVREGETEPISRFAARERLARGFRAEIDRLADLRSRIRRESLEVQRDWSGTTVPEIDKLRARLIELLPIYDPPELPEGRTFYDVGGYIGTNRPYVLALPWDNGYEIDVLYEQQIFWGEEADLMADALRRHYRSQ